MYFIALSNIYTPSHSARSSLNIHQHNLRDKVGLVEQEKGEKVLVFVSFMDEKDICSREWIGACPYHFYHLDPHFLIGQEYALN